MVKLGDFSAKQGTYFSLESNSREQKVTFGALQTRLICAVNARIHNGNFTERGLARILGVSQPQIHNVLKGVRKLRTELADRLIRSLEMSVLDLFDIEELRDQLLSRGVALASMAFPQSEFAEHVSSKAFDNNRPSPKLPGREAQRSRSRREQVS